MSVNISCSSAALAYTSVSLKRDVTQQQDFLVFDQALAGRRDKVEAKTVTQFELAHLPAVVWPTTVRSRWSRITPSTTVRACGPGGGAPAIT